jgi:hypothetical protein
MRPFFFGKAGYGDGPAAADFEDRPWRRVDLPHDWAVERPFSSRGSSQQAMKAIGRGFPENSVGWYHRELAVPASAGGQRIALETTTLEGARAARPGRPCRRPCHRRDHSRLRERKFDAPDSRRARHDVHARPRRPKSV